MTPVGPLDTPRTRRMWRAAIALTFVMACATLLTSVVLFARIQQSRVDSIVFQCTQQNLHHDAAVAKVDVLIRKLPPSRRTRAIQNRAGTVLLIDALAPKRDCNAYAKRILK